MTSMSTEDEYIFSCVRHNRLEEVKSWLQNGGDPDKRDYAGNTLLAVACQNGLKSMGKAALRAGGDINTCNDVGNTPLHFCAAYGYYDTLGAYLVSKGAEPRAVNKWGKSPMDVRVNPGLIDMAQDGATGAGAGSAEPVVARGMATGIFSGASLRGIFGRRSTAAPAAGGTSASSSSSRSRSGNAGKSTPASAAEFMRVEGHREDGRNEQQRWRLASSMLSEEWPWRTQAAPAPLGLTYLMRCDQVAWRVDDGKRVRWMPYCAGRRKAGVEEESDF